MNSEKIIQDAPLLSALLRFADQRRISLHMPGHRGGHGFPDVFRHRLAELDATELAATDDINHPSGPAADAMQAAASAFGAVETFFVTGGSTTALYAMITAFCPKGSKIIIPRAVHRSILNIALLLDLTVIFIPTDDMSSDVTLNAGQKALMPILPPQADKLRQVLARHPDARAVLVTSPDYFGICPDLSALSAVAGIAGCPLLVDEAHGAHLCFSPERLPPSALSSGASACVQSAHKTLPALTQGAFLHLGINETIHIRSLTQHVRRCLSLYQTSSPSFMIGASLDYARAFMSRNGTAAIESTLAAIDQFGKSLPAGFKCSTTSRWLTETIARDPMRIVIDVSETGHSGFEISTLLSQQGIDIEMADYRRLVLIPELIQAEDMLLPLAKALNHSGGGTWSDFRRQRDNTTVNDLWVDKDRTFYRHLSIPVLECLRPDSPLLNGRTVVMKPIKDAVGVVSAEALIPYPPGIPLVWPGEILTADTLAMLRDLSDNGFCLHGVHPEDNGESLCVVT